jgi:hypothetical protein
VGPRASWTAEENFATNGIRSPDCKTHSESLYRRSSPGPFIFVVLVNNLTNLRCKQTGSMHSKCSMRSTCSMYCMCSMRSLRSMCYICCMRSTCNMHSMCSMRSLCSTKALYTALNLLSTAQPYFFKRYNFLKCEIKDEHTSVYPNVHCTNNTTPVRNILDRTSNRTPY